MGKIKAPKPAKPKVHKVDIKVVNENIINKNWQFYNSLSEADRKGVQPLIVQGWLSRTTMTKSIRLLNDSVNPYMFSFYQHPLLTFQLLTTCFDKLKPPFQPWIPFVKTTNKSKSIKVICEYFNYNIQQAKEAFPLLQPADIIGYAEELGYQTDELKGIKAELTNSSS
jgi:hypothetical protein